MDEDLALGLFILVFLTSGGLVWLFFRYGRGDGARAGWDRLLIGNLLVLLAAFALLALAGEIYYRFCQDTTDGLGYTKASARWFERHWQVNSSDYRDNVNYELKIKPGKRRITFVGDSFTAGHGVKEVEDRFTNRLRRAHPEWEIHLLAQPGFDTGDELTHLENCLAQHYQIDQVILVYCLNDVVDLFPAWAESVERVRSEATQSGWLRRNSYLVNSLYYRLFAPREAAMKRYFEYVADGYRGHHWKEQQQRLKAFRDLVASHGGRLMVVTFPFYQSLGPRYEYQTTHDQLGRFLRDLSVPHLDLLPIYQDLPRGKLNVNRFDAHPNAYAHALAAAAIEKFLLDQLSVAPERRHN